MLLVYIHFVQSTYRNLGMCLGGHLAFRAAFDPRVLASLDRVREIQGELIMIFGKKVFL